MKQIKSHKCFGGATQFWEHDSSSTKTKMKFSSFIPEKKPKGCLVWLSGLTCNEENFITKAAAQKYLNDAQLMVVCPDTSPRGLELPEEHASYDFGSGAGFYLNATTNGYKDHYKMDDYITKELHALIESEFSMKGKISLLGHSMGGHGALVLGLREPQQYCSISAFSPIVHPTQCPWGKRAFTGYLGEDSKTWMAYDACELLRAGKKHQNPILIDQGTGDEFLKDQLRTDDFISAANEVGQDAEVRYQEDYDHSYYFISTFIGDHIKHHAKYL